MRTEEQIQDRAWGIAFGHFLAQYPDNATPDDIMQLIADESEEVVYWEPFQDSPAEWIAEQIDNMQSFMVSELAWATGQEG